MHWAFDIMPDSKGKTLYAVFLVSYMNTAIQEMKDERQDTETGT